MVSWKLLVPSKPSIDKTLNSTKLFIIFPSYAERALYSIMIVFAINKSSFWYTSFWRCGICCLGNPSAFIPVVIFPLELIYSSWIVNLSVKRYFCQKLLMSSFFLQEAAMAKLAASEAATYNAHQVRSSFFSLKFWCNVANFGPVLSWRWILELQSNPLCEVFGIPWWPTGGHKWSRLNFKDAALRIWNPWQIGPVLTCWHNWHLFHENLCSITFWTYMSQSLSNFV